MKIEDIFRRRNKYATVVLPSRAQAPKVPDGLWQKCTACDKIVFKEDISNNYMCCPSCGHHFRIGAIKRLDMVFDSYSIYKHVPQENQNPLNFPGYDDKLKNVAEKSGVPEAVVTALCTISSHECICAIMDSAFIMGSMGKAVGDKLVGAIEQAVSAKLPLIIFTASGGARMQEGIISLMQMAKVSGALRQMDQEGLLYLTVLTDPTTGGVTASFAMLGDIIIAEKGALVGFAGRRVIEQTVKQKLPEDFQTAEFVLKHGFCDMIVERKDLRNTIIEILSLHANN